MELLTSSNLSPVCLLNFSLNVIIIIIHVLKQDVTVYTQVNQVQVVSNLNNLIIT